MMNCQRLPSICPASNPVRAGSFDAPAALAMGPISFRVDHGFAPWQRQGES